VGFLSLMVILVTLVAQRSLPFKFPGALAAVLAGVGLYWLCRSLGQAPPLQEGGPLGGESLPLLPEQVWHWDWWARVGTAALGKMPIILPFALATIVGGIDNTE